ncbi:dachshund homolog 2-like isoform X2 [Phycodurus eques]|uniref:dachshund homolog 2-like isoform X2 n=1 Tax=Phycodurus eques TaxID=693459 RepID=UPI002ACE6568|nr:dachshund homolog 2-like isoform X2 [Phycodurus eques]
MSLPGSPSLVPASSAALYRSPPETHHPSAAPGGTCSPAHGNSNPRPLSPRLSGGFLPATGGAPAGSLVSGLGGLGSLGSLAALSSAGPGPGPGPCGECKLVEVHGVKVASFGVHGQELICLPQVFDLFLKHLVGGLHTVYTKLKRLDITPVVCTVEQVRVLRGLGAIQPGVNRCKLISRKDFEILYQDCTSASSRPGRPPKRCSSGAGVQESPRPLHPALPGLLSPNLLSHAGLTAAAMAELQKLHKMKMMMSLQNGNESDNDDLHSNAGGSECSWDKERLSSPPAGAQSGGPGGGGGGGAIPAGGGGGGGGRGPALGAVSQQQQQQQLLANRLDLPFMMMPHPLLPIGLPPASVAMAMSQMNHLSTIANMAAAAQQIHVHRAPVIKSQPSSSASSSPERLGPLSADADVALADAETPVKKITKDKEEERSLGQALPAGFPAPFLFADSLSSVETLLTNIQGLLKVAVENARVQDKQIQAEKRELKMELYREREMRESLERQLTSELQSRASIQKRLKKEKKAKRKLQEALEFESKRRERDEDALKRSSSSSPEPPHADDDDNAADAASDPREQLNGKRDGNGAVQESRAFLKTTIMF